MWIANNWKEYEVIDCSVGEKLERWGKYILLRPDPQVIWDTEKKTDAGVISTPIITEVKRAAVSGSFLICRNSGIFIIKILPSI